MKHFYKCLCLLHFVVDLFPNLLFLLLRRILALHSFCILLIQTILSIILFLSLFLFNRLLCRKGPVDFPLILQKNLNRTESNDSLIHFEELSNVYNNERNSNASQSNISDINGYKYCSIQDLLSLQKLYSETNANPCGMT